jgi:hypothetical protein
MKAFCSVELVDLDGFEPSTSSMPWKRAPNCATGPLEQDFFEDITVKWNSLRKFGREINALNFIH